MVRVPSELLRSQTAQSEYTAAAIPGEGECSFRTPCSQKCGIGMGIQTFGIRNRRGTRPDCMCCAFIERDQADDFDKIPDVQGRGKARRATCRHDVTRSREVIAEDFKGMLTQEYTSCVFHLFHPTPRVARREAKVFRRILVCELQSFLQIASQHCATSVLE